MKLFIHELNQEFEKLTVKLASIKNGAQINISQKEDLSQYINCYIIYNRWKNQDPMSSLTVILSSLNCDLKTDTKPSTCPMKLSRSSCNNKKLYTLPIYIVTSQVNYM